MKPNSATRLPDGGFMVTAGGLARTVRISSSGALLWQYADPVERLDGAGKRLESEANGAVPLADGTFLICGSTRSSGAPEANETILLTTDGRLIDRRTEVPPAGYSFQNSGFARCFIWNERVVLIGYGSDGINGYSWIVSLNKTGQDKREFLLPTPMDTVAPAQSATGLLFVDVPNERNITLRKVALDWTIAASAPIPGQFPLLLHAMSPDTYSSVITYEPGGTPQLHELDSALHEEKSPVSIEAFDATQGCGYRLLDGSILLFGRRDYAAVAWISRSGETWASKQFDETRYDSFSVSEAVPLSRDQFVAFRYNVGTANNGLMMSWVRLH
jgi:hypothetical protein